MLHLLTDESIREELKDIIHIQLRDNVKARILDNALSNNYVSSKGQKRIRSQIETYNYLRNKIQRQGEITTATRGVEGNKSDWLFYLSLPSDRFVIKKYTGETCSHRYRK